MILLKKEFHGEFYDKVFMVGDLHGALPSLKNMIKTNDANSLFIVAGDCGIGFYSSEYYIDQFTKLQKTCDNKNSCICFVRGNHDNPGYWNPDYLYELDHRFVNGFDKIIFIKDYDIIHTIHGNVLAIGGGISIDRSIRSLNKDYWPSEFINSPSPSDWQRLQNQEIDIVVSHSAPWSFKPVGVKSNIVDVYCARDKSLQHDLIKERELLQDIYIWLAENKNLHFWYYGHFHNSFYNMEVINDNTIRQIGLNIEECKEHYPITFEE